MAEARPAGFWKDITNVKNVLEALKSKLGHFPTTKEIYVAGYSGMLSALNRYHGGINAIAESLGEQAAQRPAGYWTLDRVVKTCREIAAKNGDSFIRTETISALDGKYRGLIGGVNKYTLSVIQEHLGIAGSKHTIGFWTDERLTEEARKIIDKYGFLPTQTQLNRDGYTAFVGGVQRNMSLTKLRKKLKLPIKKRENGYWTEKRILRECRKVVRENGDLPVKGDLGRLGLGALAGQIERNGGYHYFRTLLGLDLRMKQKNYWNRTNTYREADDLYQHFGKLPSGEQINKIGKSALSNAIIEHFGSKEALQRKLEQAHNYSDERAQSLRSLSYVQEELRRLQQERNLKRIPGTETLRKLGHSDIVSAINRYHGGMNNVRVSLGLRAVAKNGTWGPEKVLNEVRTLTAANGWTKLPPERVLKEKGSPMLVEQIRKHYGGMTEFRKKLGEKPLHAEHGVWQNVDYVFAQALKAMKEIGYSDLPPQKVLGANGYTGLSAAISNYHGGFPIFREKLREYMHQPTQRNQTENLLEGYVNG